MLKHIANGDNYTRYWIEYHHGRHRVSLVVRVDRCTDDISADVFVHGHHVSFARWEQCDHLRSVKFTTIGKRYAWLCDAMRDEYGIIVPMEG